MKLRTKIEVSFNDGIVSQSSAIVEGLLNSSHQMLRFGFDYNFGFEYIKEDGTRIAQGDFPLTKEEVNGLYEIVKSSIPVDLNYIDATLYLYYLGMRVKMAETFGVSINDIEIIND